MSSTQGQKVSFILLEPFVENLVNAFVQGNVTVGDWSDAKGADIEVRTLRIYIPLFPTCVCSEQMVALPWRIWCDIGQCLRSSIVPSAQSKLGDVVISSTYNVFPSSLTRRAFGYHSLGRGQEAVICYSLIAFFQIEEAMCLRTSTLALLLSIDCSPIENIRMFVTRVL